MAIDLQTSATGAVTDPFAALFSPAGVDSLVKALTAAFGSAGTTVTSGSKTGVNQQSSLSSSTTESPLALQQLQLLLPGLQDQASSKDYSKQAAIADAQGGVQEILRNLKENSLPGAYSAENRTGGYNSTSKTILGNDLTARAAGQAQALVTDTVGKYAGIQQGNQNTLLNAIRTAADASKTTTGQTATLGTTQEQSSSTSTKTDQGLLGNSGFQTAAGLMAALAASKAFGPDVLSVIAKALGLSGGKLLPDGTVDWGSLTGSGGEGGWPGDTTGTDFTGLDPTDTYGIDPTQIFGD